MLSDFTRARIYERGFEASDFSELKPGYALVEPLRPPQFATSGLEFPDHIRNLPGQACLLYRVLMVADHDGEGNVWVEPGDVVSLANAALDPIQPDCGKLVVRVEHIYAKVRAEPVA